MPALSRPTAPFPDPLPARCEFLRNAGVVVRSGQFSLLAAASGVGKTLMAVNYALWTGVPTVYFSADSDESTVRLRVNAALTGQPQAKVEADIRSGGWADYYLGVVKQADHVDWCYRSDLDIDFITNRLKSHREVWGSYPALIVVDNLLNTVAAPDAFGELGEVCQDLQVIARKTGAHVLALHHVTGAKEDGWQPIWQSDLLGKLAKWPEIVLGLCRQSGSYLTLTVAKNRGGPSGSEHSVYVDYEKATIGGFDRD